jgi:hypothetical protein
VIHGKDWAWGHIPRTGGDATALSFMGIKLLNPDLGIRSGIWEDGYKEASDETIRIAYNKHQTFEQEQVSKKAERFLNIRLLPCWYMSWVAQTCHRIRPEEPDLLEKEGWNFKVYGQTHMGETFPGGKLHPCPTKKQILGEAPYEPEGVPKAYHNPWDLADRFLLAFWDAPPTYIMRMEYMREDFARLMRERFNIEVPWPDQMKSPPSKIPLPYDHNPSNWMSKDELATLYKNNPNWADVEAELYKT